MPKVTRNEHESAEGFVGPLAAPVVRAAPYTAAPSWAILEGVAAVPPLRVDEQHENRGLDPVLHDEADYRLWERG